MVLIACWTVASTRRILGLGARSKAPAVPTKSTFAAAGGPAAQAPVGWHSAISILVAVRTFLPPCSLTVPIAVVRIGASFVAGQIPLSWWKSLATLFFARWYLTSFPSADHEDVLARWGLLQRAFGSDAVAGDRHRVVDVAQRADARARRKARVRATEAGTEEDSRMIEDSP